MNNWLIQFQNEVNKLAESDCLIFTAEVWNIKEDEDVKNDKLTIITDKTSLTLIWKCIGAKGMP